MDPLLRLKQVVLLLGDIGMLYMSLGLTLLLRYTTLSSETLELHLGPFSIVFIFWIVIFYIGGLYEMRELKNGVAFASRLGIATFVATALSVLLFYFVPAFVITPKTNLFLFVVVFGLAEYIWRSFYNNILSSGSPANRVLLVGYNNTAAELEKQIKENPQLGYEIRFWMKEGLQDKEIDHLAQIILADKINVIVVPAHIKKSSKAARAIYKNLVLGIEVIDLATIYETAFGKVPLAELEEIWFLENLARHHRIYEALKRPAEVLITIALLPVLLPIAIVIGLAIALTSRGPIIYKQNRVGQNEKTFPLYKFRTMHINAEKDGPQWSKKNDKRATAVGRVLRRTHLDELPQIINLLKGDLSLVGPRPERPEFIVNLKKDIPFYELRHLLRPGITGWAQINYRYGSSIDDAHEKLQYEMYYIKNRSLTLDLLIVLKTIKLMFTVAH